MPLPSRLGTCTGFCRIKLQYDSERTNMREKTFAGPSYDFEQTKTPVQRSEWACAPVVVVLLGQHVRHPARNEFATISRRMQPRWHIRSKPSYQALVRLRCMSIHRQEGSCGFRPGI